MNTLFKNFKTLNDDGWILSSILCLIVMLYYINFTILSLLSIVFIAIGVFYEQTIEWLAHGWLQHYECKIFYFFNLRHERHHKDPLTHHALQPIIVFIPVVFLLLFPFILVVQCQTSFIYRSYASGIIIGFLGAHILLNLLHYDIHAKNKIIPFFLRNTWYYKGVKYFHLHHHYSNYLGPKMSKYPVYGISNPWLDIFYYKIGLNNLVDRFYPKFIFFLQKALGYE